MPAEQELSLYDLLNYARPGEIQDLVDAIRKFETGEWSPDQFKKFRLSRGTYGQRQPDVSMERVKIPQGILTADHLEVLGQCAEKYSRGFGHVTTRQNIQFHFCKLADIPALQYRLAEVGLTSREACGNTVRNVTACPYTGVAPGEAFDVTPYAQAVTRHFLRNPICQDLPRKFKIAFSCGHAGDCAQGAINDIGLLARLEGDVPGFRMTIGGGLSTSPENGHLLFDFLPGDELVPACEAVVRLFDRTGNRQNKARARLKYVIRKLGWEETRRLVLEELDKIRAQGGAKLAIDPRPAGQLARPRLPVLSPSPAPASDPAFARFLDTNVMAQKQPGYHAVTVRLPRGDVTAAQFRALARLSRQHGDGTVRTTNQQNMLLRNVPQSSLFALWRALGEAGLEKSGAATIVDVTSCPGADSCNLAVTTSRDLASTITSALENANGHADAVAAAADLDIKISGCPNSCGQHHVAALGFHGTVRRVGGKAMPEYQLHLGGGITEQGGATFGRQVVKIPAHRVAEAVLRLCELYLQERMGGERPRAFFQRVSEEAVKAKLADLTAVDESTVKPEEFQDLGMEDAFSVKIGAGECAA
ncbi:MAG TPA: nitrite/sulfite reductase [Polyangia bacterium]|nr:nitrite/sulfite reductase [Polyangia bacterium]